MLRPTFGIRRNWFIAKKQRRRYGASVKIRLLCGALSPTQCAQCSPLSLLCSRAQHDMSACSNKYQLKPYINVIGTLLRPMLSVMGGPLKSRVSSYLAKLLNAALCGFIHNGTRPVWSCSAINLCISSAKHRNNPLVSDSTENNSPHSPFTCWTDVSLRSQ